MPESPMPSLNLPNFPRPNGSLHRWLPPVLMSSLWVSTSACRPDDVQELQSLREQVVQLKKEQARLEEVSALERATARRQEQSLVERSAQVVACRMNLPDDNTQVFAVLQTSLGDIRLRLDWKVAPYTVQNLVSLAEGTRAFRDPSSGELVKRPFYDGLTFHRVVPEFMIQLGDLKGDGSGTPGFTLPDELNPDRHFDRPGLVGMANSGPDTNGSQFFILDAASPALDGKHTLFGEVVSGMEVVHAIARVPRDANDRPLQPVVVNKLTIERLPSP